MQLGTMEVLDCGVDWLTVTCSDYDRAEMMRRRSYEALESEVSWGNIARPWGASGFVGLMAGGVQCGERNHEWIVRLTGPVAQQNWRPFYELATNVSRIDFCCTTRTRKHSARRIAEHWSKAKRWSREKPGRPEWRIIAGARGAATITTGERVSTRYGRIYDKGVESGEAMFENAVRHEVEFKGKVAKAMTFALYRTNYLPSLVAGTLLSFFRHRGLRIDVPTGTFASIDVFARTSDFDRKLEWIAAQVRPSAQLLVHSGRGRELLAALGLSISMGQLTVLGEDN